MNDLISRKALLDKFKGIQGQSSKLYEVIFFDGVMAIIDTQPTAYDVDKVAEKIEERKRNRAANIRLNTQEYDIEREVEDAMIPYDSCLDIVKGGGKDE